VFEECRARRIPVFATLAGGYSQDPRDVVEIHAAMVQGGLEALARPVEPR
jgi:hypothetical protein